MQILSFIVLQEVVREWPKGNNCVYNQGFKDVCASSQLCYIKIIKNKLHIGVSLKTNHLRFRALKKNSKLFMISYVHEVPPYFLF